MVDSGLVVFPGNVEVSSEKVFGKRTVLFFNENRAVGNLDSTKSSPFFIL